MKKLLILAYDFPPYVSVGGLRPYNWYRYLKEYGIEPIVVTRQWSNTHKSALDYIARGHSDQTITEVSEYGTVLYAPYTPTLSNRLLYRHGNNKYSYLRKSLTATHDFKQFLWISGAKREIYETAKKYLQKNPVDMIIATGDPFVLFLYAKKLGKEFHTPWIADYRDPWSQDKRVQANILFHNWNKMLEKKIVSTSVGITTVSGIMKYKLQEYFPQKNIYIIPNGYDPEAVSTVSKIPQSTDKLTISFVGTIYEWHPWRSFLKEFSDFIEQGEERDIQLNLYGINIETEIRKTIDELPEKSRNAIQICPKLSNMELLSRLARENVMLLFNDYSILGTKIFDYLGTRRKILLCYANDEDALRLKEAHYTIDEVDGMSKQLQVDLMRETNAGVIAENATHLKQLLDELHQEFLEKGKIECASTGVENYSRKIQVKKLADIVQSL